ncbi:hypothetical protein Pmani_005169 [Petrolisthes manimaculis]|uniref:Uncharacterized protein n=1 Tax=Petrolisthes manimaculis TaxID=1843537 RepID=A0AAE1QCN2_9EUCA|nr:hypothetical protein Pmani_005169 [Petrolisthes manimaculis]
MSPSCPKLQAPASHSFCFLQFTRVRPLHLPDGRPNAVDSELLLIHRQELGQLLETAGAICKTCLTEYQLMVKNTGIDSQVKLESSCPDRNYLHPETVDVPQESRNYRKYFLEGNVTLVYHSIITNQGYAGFDKLAGILQRPSIPSIAFHHIVKYIYRKHTPYYNKSNVTAYQIVKEHYKKHYKNRVSSDGMTDIDFTFDGS